jgi:hypothetical protein
MKGGGVADKLAQGLYPFKIYSPVHRHQVANGLMDFPLGLYRIVQGEAPGQFRFSFNRKVGRSQKPLARAYNFFFIRLFYFCTSSCFAYQFDGRDKEVEKGAQGAADGGEGVPPRGGGETVIAHEVSDAGEVFLLGGTVVVFAAGPGAGKLDTLAAAPFGQGGIDKLAANA